MNRSNVRLLDLPNEMLFYIFKKLDNVDVLYSLFGINNERLDNLTREGNFSDTLNFTSRVYETTTIASILHRFCNDILPQIHYNVKGIIVEPTSMERILLATPYPNLTELKIFNFQRDNSLQYFTDDSPLRPIFKQTRKLDLIIKHCENEVGSSRDYTRTVYAHILTYFQNLVHFKVVQASEYAYPCLLVSDLPSNTLSSSTLTYLCINVRSCTDCLCLLDRLKQLTTFLVKFIYVGTDSSMVHNLNDLPNMKCFSLISYRKIKEYDNKIVSLFRRMGYLEKLTLYLRVAEQGVLMDPICLINEFSMCMPRLQSFKFYLSTVNNRDELVRYMFNNNITQNYANIGYQEVSNIICDIQRATYHIFTLPPLEFTLLFSISNVFPNIRFSYVTDLYAADEIPFEHEFFLRIAKAFPLLKTFMIMNIRPQSCDAKDSSDNIQSFQIVEYPHLTSLDISRTNITYVEQFLNETKTYLPCLAELIIKYEDLIIITKDSTRDATRRNCANVKQLSTNSQIVGSKDYHIYFPLL